MTKKIPKINVEQTKDNERLYPYLYSIRDIEASMCALTKEAS